MLNEERVWSLKKEQEKGLNLMNSQGGYDNGPLKTIQRNTEISLHEIWQKKGRNLQIR